METAIKTGEVRFGYAYVFEPRKNGDEEKESYSIMLIIDKEDKETLKAIQGAVNAAKEKGKEKWGGKIPGGLKLPLRDGDEDRPDSPELAGKYFLNAKSKNRPRILKKEDGALVPITDPMEFKSGDFGKATINFYPFSFNGNRGVGVGLNNLFKTRSGDPLSGGSSAENDFKDEIDEAEDWTQ